MATFYLDPEGGNDANDGTSFAQRWKTFNSGATAARVAPGDVIRIKASPEPTSLGITATWTNKSRTVTLASALNALITDCQTAWTASADVTATADTTIYRAFPGDEGAAPKSAKLAIASGFTTGLVAYFALGGAQDYSAYQGITFWVYVSAALAASTLSIKLCSDAAGATPVDTFAIPAIASTEGVGSWFPVYVDKGSALGASIQSIALYADLDPGAIDVYLDNIATTKAAGDDCLNYNTMIGKNVDGETWWQILKINGTTLTLDNAPGLPTFSMTTGQRGYTGTTETVSTWIRKTFRTVSPQFSFQAVATIQEAGTAGNHTSYLGGWNPTDMSTQTGETWFDGGNGWGTGLVGSGYTTLDKLCFTRYAIGFQCGGSFYNSLGTLKVSNCCNIGIDLAGCSNVTATLLYAVACENYGINFYTSQSNIAAIKSYSHGNTTIGYGVWVANASLNVKIGTIDSHNNAKDGWSGTGVEFRRFRLTSVTCRDNGRYGFTRDHGSSSDFVIDTLTCTDNGEYGAFLSSGETLIKSYTSSGNVTGSILGGTPGSLAHVHTILKSSMAEATKFQANAANNGLLQGGVRFRNYNSTANDHRFYMAGSTARIDAETTVRHTASGLAWKMQPLTSDWISSDYPLVLPLAKLAVRANALVTVSVWMRRTNTGITGKLFTAGGVLNGVASDVSNSITVAADTWEKVTISFTPTEAGVVEIQAHAYGGTTYTLYVDDVEWSQA
jgi:hypothetical protein